MSIRAIIFDLDGVITDTSEYHYLAWQQLADEEGLTFNREINEQLRGVSRAQSLRIILGDRDVDDETFQTWMDRKNRYYNNYLEEITSDNLLPGIRALLDELEDAGIPIAIGSASRNARTVIDNLGIADRFAVIGDGHSVERGKPAPDLFLFIADKLNVSPRKCVVVEDATSGITAALRGGFWAAGVGPASRVGHAHVCFGKTSRLTWSVLRRVPSWVVTEHSFDPDALHHKETVFTNGNGYLSSRGAFEEGYPGEERATLIHGIFDDVPITFTELANAPDWLHCQVFVNGDRVRLDHGVVRDYERTLSLHNGRLARRFVWQADDDTPAVQIEFQRTSSRADRHLNALDVAVTPLDATAEIEIRAGIMGCVENDGQTHWDHLAQGGEDDTVWLHSRTRATEIDLITAARLALNQDVSIEQWQTDGNPTLVARTTVPAGEHLTATKIVAYASSRDDEAPLQRAQRLVANTPADFNAVLLPSAERWNKIWNRCDVVIDGDDEAQLATRFNLFQLLIAAPDEDLDVSIAAKSLSGFGYAGHVFWDTEIFILPFFIYTLPHIARNFLLYRYRRLPAAREKAAGTGYEGAQFPWESAGSGKEVTPTWVPHPTQRDTLIRIWTGDNQIHITADIAYAILQYWRATGDDEFMAEYGAEMVLDGAKFLASRAEYNEARDRYEYTDVMGPDEYHEHVDNNAFTNRLAQWHLDEALTLLDWLAEHAPERRAGLVEALDLTDERLATWQEVIDKMYLPGEDDGSIEQFEGFFDLNDADLEAYEPRSESMYDVLGPEHINDYQVLKQPDVLMMLYLLRHTPDVTYDIIEANWDYYNPRTDHTHGSSLGPSITAVMACELGNPNTAYEHFMRAARTDLRDLRGNAGHGIHAASAGGVWQALVFGFAGLSISRETSLEPWQTRPRLPAHWNKIRFTFYYRGAREEVTIHQEDT